MVKDAIMMYDGLRVPSERRYGHPAATSISLDDAQELIWEEAHIRDAQLQNLVILEIPNLEVNAIFVEHVWHNGSHRSIRRAKLGLQRR